MSRTSEPARSRICRIVLACLVLASIGCGRKVYPVKGTVTWPDGTPAKELAGGMVQFDLITENPKERVSPQGGVAEDGSYRLTSFVPQDGAPAGKYRVLVMPLAWTEGMLGDKPAPPPVMQARFKQFETSGIEVVVEARDNDLPIRVEKVKKR